MAETVQPSSPYAMKAGWGQGVVGRRTAQKQGARRQGGLRKLLDRRLHLAAGRRRLESPLVDALRVTYTVVDHSVCTGWCWEALAAGAGSSGNSLIDGSVSPQTAACLRAMSVLMTGLSAGSFLMTPLGTVGGPVGRSNLDQKTAGGLGAWAANMALALSESTAPASGAFSAAGSFLRTSSVPDFATEMLDGTWPVPVLAVPVPPVPVSMPSLNETGSEGMPTALPPPE